MASGAENHRNPVCFAATYRQAAPLGPVEQAREDSMKRYLPISLMLLSFFLLHLDRVRPTVRVGDSTVLDIGKRLV